MHPTLQQSGRATKAVFACLHDCGSDSDLLDLIERELIVGAIVELGGAWTLVCSHGLGVLQRTAVIQVCGDTGRAEGMVANLGWDAGIGRAART